MMKLLDRADLEELGIKYSPSQLWRKERAGTFPKSIMLSPSRKGWIESEIYAYLKQLKRQRDETAA